VAFVSQRWIGRLLIVAALGLAPWTILLSFRLPAEHTSHHWDAAWVGFDVALTVAVAATALGIHRRELWSRTPAAVAATLLLTDAWFDNLLASGTAEHFEAALATVLVELPLALVCLWVAANTARAIDAVNAARGSGVQ
jgi:hypothetical protein